MKDPLVSIIITTKNEEKVIKDLLISIHAQTYKNHEIILVDNNSSDQTIDITQKFTQAIFQKGPERSAQRNYGVEKSHGEYVLILDADMILNRRVVESCVHAIIKNNAGGVIIPEKSFGRGFWSGIKAYERSFYQGDDKIEAARFFPKKTFKAVGGYDENINGPEDWDLSDRIKNKYKLCRIKDFIVHNEEYVTLWDIMKKKFYYGLRTPAYLKKNSLSIASPKTIFFFRSVLYRSPKKILQNPLKWSAMIIMLLCELVAGGFGYSLGLLRMKK